MTSIYASSKTSKRPRILRHYNAKHKHLEFQLGCLVKLLQRHHFLSLQEVRLEGTWTLQRSQACGPPSLQTQIAYHRMEHLLVSLLEPCNQLRFRFTDFPVLEHDFTSKTTTYASKSKQSSTPTAKEKDVQHSISSNGQTRKTPRSL
jgi:hypothetical protein